MTPVFLLQVELDLFLQLSHSLVIIEVVVERMELRPIVLLHYQFPRFKLEVVAHLQSDGKLILRHQVLEDVELLHHQLTHLLVLLKTFMPQLSELLFLYCQVLSLVGADNGPDVAFLAPFLVSLIKANDAARPVIRENLMLSGAFLMRAEQDPSIEDDSDLRFYEDHIVPLLCHQGEKVDVLLKDLGIDPLEKWELSKLKHSILLLSPLSLFVLEV
eukprot:CAMPEP_0170566962 /NCGR_PEP_ID=MMETSP0211-20121228/80172_1 /TAXON_ID=311385 /ORGANISM="Pseudokeronopsis sp., Strain OXSARD2" /LENGTH=215 /DNA_ID=CAMNT_0010888283 /DNA_START=282 /DNA_END=929 /DNA_ORIENTATION=+